MEIERWSDLGTLKDVLMGKFNNTIVCEADYRRTMWRSSWWQQKRNLMSHQTSLWLGNFIKVRWLLFFYYSHTVHFFITVCTSITSTDCAVLYVLVKLLKYCADKYTAGAYGSVMLYQWLISQLMPVAVSIHNCLLFSTLWMCLLVSLYF